MKSEPLGSKDPWGTPASRAKGCSTLSIWRFVSWCLSGASRSLWSQGESVSLEEMRRLVQEELSKQLDGEDACPTI